ncbi:peptidylprolyl isomerase [Paenibacillus melissococcoides]|uniref:Peptidylprolyl isomerase n=1 Tax=Paenibacillus melissococcoides TaxID=2912268 RepID=A0ABM9G6Y8_9BACL|nr:MULTISPECIES: peptidylprolyl isomerase [Paenibacillus]MEB9897275.1 peptidylprolyl isomerase [Bacillus cereus]CAH8247649.1 peptidylprolyl isomerase [Paenibacillus melissococcoides]CAH8705554.1 peptidylprolyl isomerase [Paenibacillus melissococcoides]CAH8715027.1 peptidylprolyl isomerase [Paenibacillus melissococcoides]GIO78099.1 foldase protein PrsA [Paenibacillus dendritiformis]
MLQNKQMRSKKWLLLALSAVLTLSVLAGCGKKDTTAAAKDGSKVVATYEGGEVTEDEFKKEMATMLVFYPEYEQIIGMEQFQEYFLKQQIAYLYLEGKASDKAKKTGEEKAKEQLDLMKTQAGADEFKKMLDAQKLTEADVTAYMTRILTVVQDYNDKVTDEQLKAEFEKNKKDLTVATVRHVLIGFEDKNGKERKKEDALKLAKDIQTRLKKGEDFAKVAKENSDDTGSADNGGLYQDVAVGNWVPQFKEAALTLPINEISDPVETDYGYHVMRVEARAEKTFDKLTDTEKTSLRTQAASELMNDFMEKELDNLIKKIDLPKTEEPADSTGENKDTTQDDKKNETPQDNNAATDQKEDKAEGTK